MSTLPLCLAKQRLPPPPASYSSDRKKARISRQHSCGSSISLQCAARLICTNGLAFGIESTCMGVDGCACECGRACRGRGSFQRHAHACVQRQGCTTTCEHAMAGVCTSNSYGCAEERGAHHQLRACNAHRVVVSVHDQRRHLHRSHPVNTPPHVNSLGPCMAV
jgi:hypothetical protein